MQKSMRKYTKKSNSRRNSNQLRKEDTSLIRLNKYLANAGICSRREADKFIEAGVVSVNGKSITQMGYKVKTDDIVKFNDSTIKNQKLQYILLNKPKNYVSSYNDPKKRNSIMRLIEGKCKELVLPIGKLDKITTGLILFTNDNDLVKKAATNAKLDKLINGLNEGLDTNIGEFGDRISGGQRQRIAIARALYTDPKVLILDECTNSLDLETEKQILKEVNSFKGEKTIIMITHRPSTLENCDYIYKIDKEGLKIK